jgi:hypothetical protein
VGSPSAIVYLLVMAVTAVYLVVFCVRLPGVLAAIYDVGDTDIAPYLTQSWEHAPAGSHMLMANAPWYSADWVMRVLGDLPDHRGSWELAPWVISALAAGWVGWATARAAGRAAGLLVAGALICTGTMLLPLQFSWSIHGVAYVHVLLLGAFVVWLAHDPWSQHTVRFWCVVAAMLVASAAGVASDKLVLVAGLLPFAVAGTALIFLAPATARLRLGASVAAVAIGASWAPSRSARPCATRASTRTAFRSRW